MRDGPLSFSELDRAAGCGRAVWEARHQPRRATAEPASTRSGGALLGRWAHKGLELLVAAQQLPIRLPRTEVDDIWNEAWSDVAVPAHGHDWTRLPGSFLVRATVEAWLSDPTIANSAGGSADAEYEATTSDGLVFGRIDVVLSNEQGAVSVWDLKTAEAGGGLSERTRSQLELYAALLIESGHRVVAIGVIGNTRWASEPIDTTSCESALELHMRTATELAAGRVPEPSPARSACISCPWLANCESGMAELTPFSEPIDVDSFHQYSSGDYVTYGSSRQHAGPLQQHGALPEPGPALLIRVDGHLDRVLGRSGSAAL